MTELENKPLGTKAVERILRHEIDNWLQWGRRRDYLPASFKCVLGRIRIHERIPLGDDRYNSHDFKLEAPTESSAANFERVVIGLPDRHMRAFVMYHMGKAVINGRVVKIKDRETAARVLGVRVRMAEYIVSAAHNMVFREWQKKVADNH